MGLYVLKFRGAGQGAQALIAELVAGGDRLSARPARCPSSCSSRLIPALGRAEPDPRSSVPHQGQALGLNLAPRLSARRADLRPAPPPARRELPGAASAIVWFDAFITNVDRTARNPICSAGTGPLADRPRRGALLPSFSAGGALALSPRRAPFPQIADHVLLPGPARSPRSIAGCFAAHARRHRGHRRPLPDAWLGEVPRFPDAPPSTGRPTPAYLLDRLEAPRAFLEEAIRARARLV